MRFARSVFHMVLFAFVLSLPVSLYAAPQQTFYVSATELPPQLLPAPPAEGSPAWKKQIIGVMEWQARTTPSDVDAMRYEQGMPIELMTRVLGDSFTRERNPRTFALLDKVFHDVGVVTKEDKMYWHTRRPYLTDHNVKLMVDPLDANPAYPSGHTSESRVLAEVLGMLYPAKLETLRAQADAIARHRIEAGVHYPFDIEGGNALAMLIVGALIKTDAFKDDLADAREEIAATQ